MGKKVLAIYYSQSGQLAEIVHQLTAPLTDAGASVEVIRIEPIPDYPFPWTRERFYSVMPDCVLGVTGRLASFTLKETAYDLIVLGYQAWFLYPSIPVNTLLHDPAFRQLLKNTPIVTITGARNMWLNTFLEIKKLIHSAGGRLVGNIALVDRHPNHISFFTILHWLMGGKKDRYLKIFPLPGVSAADITRTAEYGRMLVPRLLNGEWEGMQEELVQQHAVNTRYSLVLLESIAIPTYEKWARFIVKRKKRKAWLAVFRYYLLFSLFVAAPILLAFNAALIKPFSSKRMKEKRSRYLSLN
jgi:hypothetical protein